jgi:heme exporter protein A
MSPSRLVVEAVTKRFGSTLALRGMDVSLRPGLTRLEGANGSGKSTLLGVLAGTLKPTSGRVVWGDGTIIRREDIGFVSHDSLAYGDLTGRQNILFAAEVHGLSGEDVWRDVVERFELGDFAERRLRTNSRGQKQRVALARALLHQPKVVLLDEPTTGLDATGIQVLRRVIEQEIEAKRWVVVVTHDGAGLAGLAADRLVLERGRVVSRETIEARTEASRPST